MAAPMENMRIRISFTDFPCSFLPNDNQVWFLVRCGSLKCIGALKKEILVRHGIPDSLNTQLRLDGFLLPDWESPDIIRDNDHIVLRHCQEDEDQSHISHKKKHKRKHRKEVEEANDQGSISPCWKSDQNQEVPGSYAKEGKRKRKSLKRSASPSDVSVSNDEDDVIVPRKASKVPRQSSAAGSADADVQLAASPVPESRKVAEMVVDKDQLCDDTNSMSEHKRKRRKRKHKKKNKTSDMSLSFVCDTPVASMLSPIYKSSPAVSPPNVSKPPGSGSSKVNTGAVATRDGMNAERKVIRSKRTSANERYHVHFDSDQEETAKQDESKADDSPANKNEEPSVATGVSTDNSQQAGSYNSVPPPPSSQSERTAEDLRPKGKTVTVKTLAKGPFANAKVFNRQRFKKNAYYPLSKEEQLATVCDNKSVIYTNTNGTTPSDDAASEQPAETTTAITDNLETAIEPKDYSTCTPLHGPPRNGDVIAYKILEMGENYCPELSDFKEAKVLCYDPATQRVDLELIHAGKEKNKEGRFELTIEDDEEILTNTGADQKVMVQLTWTSLVDTRLV